MEKLPKISGRGSRVKRAWEDVGRTGGEAPTPEEVAQYLSGNDNTRCRVRKQNNGLTTIFYLAWKNTRMKTQARFATDGRKTPQKRDLQERSG